MKVHILMSTYNGEAFLAEQIQSIQAQTVTDWRLLIRDDGSSDRTQQIIKEFVQTDGRIRFINENNPTNLGVIKSFHALAHHEVADVYFFSDQDDVWLPEKLELTLKEAAKYDIKQPLLVYTDLKVVDQDLKVLSESMIRSQSHHANTSLLAELTENTVTGGVSMANHALIQLWQETDDLLMHDWYLALLATACGQLVYLDVPTQLYRQHGHNVLGARTWSKRLKKWVQPHLLFQAYWNLITKSQTQAKWLLDKPLTADKKDLVTAYIKLLEQPASKRLSALQHYGFKKNRLFHTCVFRFLVWSKFAYKE